MQGAGIGVGGLEEALAGCISRDQMVSLDVLHKLYGSRDGESSKELHTSSHNNPMG